MLIVDSLLIGGIRFVLTRLVEAVDAELYDETHLREELLAAQMKLELGEIDEEAFERIEGAVLRGLRDVAERKRGAAEGAREREPGPGERFAVERIDAVVDHESLRGRP